MFELLFTRPAAIERYRSAPLLKERLSHLAHCGQLGIKPETLCRIAAHQLNLVRLLDLQDDEGLNLLYRDGNDLTVGPRRSCV